MPVFVVPLRTTRLIVEHWNIFVWVLFAISLRIVPVVRLMTGFDLSRQFHDIAYTSVICFQKHEIVRVRIVMRSWRLNYWLPSRLRCYMCVSERRVYQFRVFGGPEEKTFVAIIISVRSHYFRSSVCNRKMI